MVQSQDGYYYQQGSSTPHFWGTDNRWHPVIQVQDTTGSFANRSAFIQYMTSVNNSFTNNRGEVVEFTRALIVYVSTTSRCLSAAIANWMVELRNTLLPPLVIPTVVRESRMLAFNLQMRP